MRILLAILIAVSAFGVAQDTRILAHTGCPVKFTVPDDWSGDSTNRCSYTFTNGEQRIDINLYSGSLRDAEMLYWRASESEDEYQPITIGQYKGIHREEPRMYVISNGDLVVVATSQQQEAPIESFELLLRGMRFSGKSKKGDGAHHPVLFDRKCGVFADYPADMIAKPGKNTCSVELYSAWPPPASGFDTLEVRDEFPEDFCRYEPAPGELKVEIEKVTNSNWTLFKENGSTRGYGPAGYQGLRDWEAWIFTDGCHTLTLSDPSEHIGATLLKTVKFEKTTCDRKIIDVPQCKE